MSPCCVSTTTQSWPERAASSAVQVLGMVHQAPTVASPARQRSRSEVIARLPGVPANSRRSLRVRGVFHFDGVDDVEWRMAIEDQPQVFADHLHQPDVGLDSGAAGMRCEDHVVDGAQRRVDSERLDLIHVERSPRQVARSECLDERFLVHDRAAGGVDEEGSALHLRECRGADEGAGVDIERSVDANDVASSQQLVEVDALRAREVPGHHISEQDPGAEGGEPPRHRRADVAEADDADGRGGQLPAEHLFAHRVIRPPPPSPHRSVAPEGVAQQRDHRHHGPVGHRLLVVASRVGHRDPELGGGAMVDGIEADGRHLHQLAAAHALEHLAVDAMLVTLIADHQVGARACGQYRGLGGWRRDQHDIDLVPPLEHGPYGGFVVWAEAGEAGVHWPLRLAVQAGLWFRNRGRPGDSTFRAGPQPFQDSHHQATDLLACLRGVLGIGHVEAGLAERAGKQKRKRAQRLRLDDPAMHRLAQRPADADGAVTRLDHVHDVPVEDRSRVVQRDPAHGRVELGVDHQLAAAGERDPVVWLVELAHHLVRYLAHHLFVDLLEQGGLAAEVVVDGALGDACAGGDLLDRGGGVPALPEQLAGRRDEREPRGVALGLAFVSSNQGLDIHTKGMHTSIPAVWSAPYPEYVSKKGDREMPKFVIERDLPGAGNLSPEQLRTISQKSNKVIADLGPEIHWLHSYVTDDKLYCVYVAPDEDIILEHARCGGFPANKVTRLATMIDPSTGDVA